MSKVISLFESKTFIMGLLTTAAAAGAVLGFKVPVGTILAVLTPLMIAIGAQGWSDVVQMKAKMQLEHAVKMHALMYGNSTAGRDGDGKYQPRTVQAGFATLGILIRITAFGAALALCAAVVETSNGCATAQPVVTDVIDCATAEAAVVGNGFSIAEIVTEVYAAIQGGVDGVLVAIENLITKYGGEIVACAIDNYPESPASGSGSGSAVPAVVNVLPAVQAKHAALAKFFPGKKINHTFKKR